MAKIRTPSTRSPLEFVAGKEITTSLVAAAVEQVQYTTELAADYCVSQSPRYQWIINPAVSEVIYGTIWVNPDCQTIVSEIRSYAPDFGVGESCRFRLTIGTASIINITLNNANAGALIQNTVTTASAGTGVVYVTAISDTHVGAHTLQRLDLFSLYAHRRTTIGVPPNA